jgi:hypothetical protein
LTTRVSNRVGVDVVVLADCSGSMALRDVPGAARGTRTSPFVRRLDALRVALRRLLESRLTLSGGLSRIAILGFTTDTFPIFPADGSMEELSDTSAADTVKRCSDALQNLETRHADTPTRTSARRWTPRRTSWCDAAFPTTRS